MIKKLKKISLLHLLVSKQVDGIIYLGTFINDSSKIFTDIPNTIVLAGNLGSRF